MSQSPSNINGDLEETRTSRVESRRRGESEKMTVRKEKKKKDVHQDTRREIRRSLEEENNSIVTRDVANHLTVISIALLCHK